MRKKIATATFSERLLFIMKKYGKISDALSLKKFLVEEQLEINIAKRSVKDQYYAVSTKTKIFASENITK